MNDCIFYYLKRVFRGNMKIWAIADLHLSFGVPNKEMHVFGEKWRDHPKKIKEHWESKISDEDIVLIPGDISWGKHLEEALPDLLFIHSLPGKFKILLKGNHDYWWSAINKVRKILPPSLVVLQNDSFTYENISVGGARLWDDYSINFDPYIEYIDIPCAKNLTEKDNNKENAEEIYKRELLRLERSLSSMDANAKYRIAMTHYPPIGPLLENTQAFNILKKYNINYTVFGHIHSLKHQEPPLFGIKDNINFIMTAADYINFNPTLVC